MTQVSKPGFQYQRKMHTRITWEQSTPDNPFVAQQRRTFGYDQQQLWQSASLGQALLLLFKGDIPSAAECQLFEILMIGLSNLGPKHPAIRAAMLAGLSKTNAEHILPLGLSVAAGERDGAREVMRAHRFITAAVAGNTQPLWEQDSTIADKRAAPGFGQHCGTVDPVMQKLAATLFEAHANAPTLHWCQRFLERLKPHNQGILASGLVACVAVELNIGERESAGLFQLMLAPGIFAHGIEQSHFPITAGPMLEDHDYELR